jgi:dienelactone hydrolase
MHLIVRSCIFVTSLSSILLIGWALPVRGQSPVALPVYSDKMDLLCWIDESGRKHPVVTRDDWQKRREHILANMQQVMGTLPNPKEKSQLEVQVLETEELPTVTRKKILYQAGLGDMIPAYLLVPKNLVRPAPAMLCMHGTSGGRGRTAGIGADYPRYTLELAERGYVTIAPDYTLLGDNQTDPESLGYASGTMKGIWSHIRAIDLLESLSEVDASRIGCIGVSLGGHNGLFVGAFDTRLKVVVTSSGFDSFLDYMGGDPTGWCQKRYMPRIQTLYAKQPDKIPFDFQEVLAAIAPRALYIHAPQSDSNFRLESVKRCENAARGVFKLLGVSDKLAAVYPPGEHGFPLEERLEAYRFVDRILGVIGNP